MNDLVYTRKCFKGLSNIRHDRNSRLSWEELDRISNRLITHTTFLLLFVNDQIYNMAFELKETIKKTPYYKHGVKKNTNELFRFMDSYNMLLAGNGIDKDVMANVTQDMEDIIKPYLDEYTKEVGTVLSKSGINDNCLDHILSVADTIIILCNISNRLILDFPNVMKRFTNLTNNPLEWLSVKKASMLSGSIISALMPKDKRVDLNEHESINTAWINMKDKLLDWKSMTDIINRIEDGKENEIKTVQADI